MPYPVAAVRNRNFGVATPFVGAYDAIPNIVAAYGMRRLRTAYTGSILRIRRNSDNAEQDIGYESDGDLDTAAVATFVGGGSGYIVNWYDQSGNAYTAAQTTAASQPLYVASGQNGKPVGRWDGVDDRLEAPVVTEEHTVLCVAAHRSFPNLYNPEVSYNAGVADFGASHYVKNNLQGAAYPHANPGGSYDNLGVYLANQWFIFALPFKIGGWSGYRNGAVEGNGTATGYIAHTGIWIGMQEFPSRPSAVDIAELIICNAVLSDANREAAETAGNNYWAVF